MPVTYSGPTELLTPDAEAVEEILDRAGLLQEAFLVGVAGVPGSDVHDVMIVNLDRMCSRVYRLRERWQDTFADDVAHGMFAGHKGAARCT